MNKCKATLRPDSDDEKVVTIPALNLNGYIGKDLETDLTAHIEEVFEVYSCEPMADAMYSYILYDHRDDMVYAVQSIDLEF
jgi:hypothetical protein